MDGEPNQSNDEKNGAEADKRRLAEQTEGA